MNLYKKATDITHHHRMAAAIGELQASMDTLRVYIKVLLHDLESTRRERERESEIGREWMDYAEWLEKEYNHYPQGDE